MMLKVKHELVADLNHEDILLKRLAEVALAKSYYYNHYIQTWGELFKTKRYSRFKVLSDKCHSRLSRLIHKIGEREFENYNDTNYNIRYLLEGLDTRSKINVTYKYKDSYYRSAVIVRVVWEEK